MLITSKINMFRIERRSKQYTKFSQSICAKSCSSFMCSKLDNIEKTFQLTKSLKDKQKEKINWCRNNKNKGVGSAYVNVDYLTGEIYKAFILPCDQTFLGARIHKGIIDNEEYNEYS